tara:strand:- start:1823 stop:2284 length:462 start_codon:yes stop_codon:yes gene_type:complete
MDLRNKIDEKYKEALKSKNTDEVNILRLIRSAIKDKDISNRTSDNKELVNDQQIMIVLQSMVKQRKDTIESFKSASRDDLINKEKSEIEIINQFLPKQLNEEETKKIIEGFITKENISSIKDMGKIMGFLKKNYSGTIDLGLSGKIAKNLLIK